MDATVAITITIAVGVIVIAAEFAVRSWFRRAGDYVWRPHERTVMHLDRMELPDMPPVAHFDINRDGERGAEPPRDPEAAWRVLVVGGSAVECYYLDQLYSWPEILAYDLRVQEFLLKVGRREVHVGNIGKSGVDTAGVNLIFDRIFPRYSRLDCIVLCLGAGDVVKWLSDGAPEALQSFSDITTNIFAVQSDRKFAWSPRETALAELIRGPLGRWFPRVRERAGKKLGDVRQMRRNVKMLITSVPNPSGMLVFFEESLRNALLKAKSNAKHVLVARQPWFDKDIFTPDEERLLWHAAKGRPYEQQVDTFFSYSVFNELMRSLDEKVVTVCAETETPVLDLKALLPNSTDTYYDHLHFTTAGAERVGHAVADFVKAVVECQGTPAVSLATRQHS